MLKSHVYSVLPIFIPPSCKGQQLMAVDYTSVTEHKKRRVF